MDPYQKKSCHTFFTKYKMRLIYEPPGFAKCIRTQKRENRSWTDIKFFSLFILTVDWLVHVDN